MNMEKVFVNVLCVLVIPWVLAIDRYSIFYDYVRYSDRKGIIKYSVKMLFDVACFVAMVIAFSLIPIYWIKWVLGFFMFADLYMLVGLILFFIGKHSSTKERERKSNFK